MERDFWLARWDNQQIGFHQPKGQPLLERFWPPWPSLATAPPARVLVPLCGKTVDMAWLAAAGHRVTGVELSERAARDFFSEQGRSPQRDNSGDFIRYTDGAVEILVGDFFALDTAFIATFDAVYDRAALIALPPTLRRRYAEHLLAGLAPDARMLLITLDYDQRRMAGPPFAVSRAHVRDLYGHACEIVKLFEQDTAALDDQLAVPGRSHTTESVYRLTKR